MRFWARRRWLLLAALLLLCSILAGCGGGEAPGVKAQVLVDGAAWTGDAMAPNASDGLRVYVTLDGKSLIDLPFEEAHSVSVIQPDGEENHIRLTGDAVYMESANCENQDCVNMGAVTRENLELRVLGGFIVCLPHRVSVEVRGE